MSGEGDAGGCRRGERRSEMGERVAGEGRDRVEWGERGEIEEELGGRGGGGRDMKVSREEGWKVEVEASRGGGRRLRSGCECVGRGGGKGAGVFRVSGGREMRLGTKEQ